MCIDNTQYSFESLLHFIDYNWNLPYLNQRVADANNMLNAFDFSQSPRAPWPGTPLTRNELQSVMANASLDTPDID